MTNTIYELIALLPTNYQPNCSPQIDRLFALYQGKKRSDQEIRALFLDTQQSDAYFSQCKQKLKQDLIDALIVNPVQWITTHYQELCDICYKHFSIYKILLVSSRRGAAIEIAKKLIHKTQEIELYNLTYLIAFDLDYHYSAIEYSVNENKKFKKIAQKHLAFINAKHIVKSYYNEINLLYTTKNSFPPSVIEIFERAVKATQPYLKLKLNKLSKWIYTIKVMHCFAICDYPKVIYYCNKALRSFNPQRPYIDTFRFDFLQKKIAPLIVLKKYSQAKKIAREATTLMQAGNYNWHIVILQRIEICFHAGQFQEAYELYKAHNKCDCPNQNLQEYWKIIQAYLHFMIQVGKIKPYIEERFNLGKFLNEIPIYSQDKAGININVLIIQILIELQRGQFGRIIDRVEALQAYARKHTRRIETVRAYIFINMFIAMEKASFHRAATERKTRKLIQRLQKKPLHMGQNLSVELIPYETLWEAALDLLDNTFRAQKLHKKKEQPRDIKNQ